MFSLEHKKSRLATKKQFRHRLLKASTLSIMIFIISLSMGVTGYHVLAGLPWVDSFLNASMILGGMGPVDNLTSNTAKIFAGCYALFSGVAFISAMAIFITPILHRFLHRFHLDSEETRGV
jgi:hypothetical protein